MTRRNEKAGIWGTFLLTLLACARLGAAESVTIPVTGGANVLMDGALSDPCWKDALETGPFTLIDGKTTPITNPTSAKIFADKENLYIGFTCNYDGEESCAEAINNTAGAWAGSGLWAGGDTVEVFVDPGMTSTFTQFAVGINGTVYLNPKTGAGQVSAAVQRMKDSWSAEIKIPFKALALAGKDFKKEWRLNVCRSNDRKKELSSWAKISNGSFHDVLCFNRTASLGFVDLAKLAEERRQAKLPSLSVASDRTLYDTQKEAKFKFDLKAKGTLKKHYVEIAVKDASGKPVLTAKVKPVFLTNEFALPLAGLADGRYHVELTHRDADGAAVDSLVHNFWKIPPAPKPTRQVEVRDGNSYIDGKFFFPILTWNGPLAVNDPCFEGKVPDRETFVKLYRERVADVKKYGFNMVVMPGQNLREFAKRSLTDVRYQELWYPYGKVTGKTRELLAQAPLSYKEHLDFLEENGIIVTPIIQLFTADRFDLSPDMVDTWLEMALFLRGVNGNIWAWHLADETDRFTEENAKLHKLYKELDPQRPTWLNVITAIFQNKDACDIIATDPYPIPGGSVTMVSSRVDQVAQVVADNPKQGNLVWLQAFGEPSAGSDRCPTPGELRAMAWLAMNHGARGIGYWNYTQPERRLGGKYQLPKRCPPPQELYDELATINSRIKQIAPAFCLGKKVFGGRKGDYDITVVDYEGDRYVSAVNACDKIVADAKVELDGLVAAGEKAEVLFENRSVTAGKDAIVDVMRAYDAHIYKLAKAAK